MMSLLVASIESDGGSNRVVWSADSAADRWVQVLELRNQGFEVVVPQR
jgi:hypothetical protein